MSNIVLITKDAMNKHALPCYGNNYWKTPNIDSLAAKGTVFKRHYTAGASTAMAFTAMATGMYCYETGRRVYKHEEAIDVATLFDKLFDNGYECHIIWDSTYTSFADSHFKCQGKNTVVHSLNGIKQQEAVHKKGTFDDVSFDAEESQYALDLIHREFVSIKNKAKRDIFIWIHLPHVMRGRQGYGSDIDLLDEVVGYARAIFGDDGIFVSADHGHMNGWKGKYHYGFDVGEEAICIPLIAPLINGSNEICFPTSTLQMYDILFNRTVKPLPYVMCETAYYAQPKRKIAIVSGSFKYCYDKETKTEFLYDLDFDPEENHNLVYPEFYDVDRFLWYSTAQCFYYPRWERAQKELAKFRDIKASMWKNGLFFEEIYNKILHRIKCVYTKYLLAHPKDGIKNTGK